MVSLSFYLVNGGIVVVLLVLSGIISGSEIAFFSLSKIQLEACKESKKIQEAHILRLMENPKKLLATILILNNLVNVFIVTIATYATWQIAGDKRDGYLIVALTTIITILIIFFGEVLPKVYASQNNLLFSRFTARFLYIASFLLTPFTLFLMHLGFFVERNIQNKGNNVSVNEINQALDITSEEEDHNTTNQKDILRGIVNFGSLNVTQVMISRMDIMALDVNTDFHELMNQINKTGYSRIPIYKENIDKIEGILYTKDLIPYVDNDDNFSWQELLKPPFFVPESKKIDDLLKDFQEKRIHLAIVVDEYGGTEGLITLEDVIEEIVGEIHDEFDNEDDNNYNKLDNHTFIFESKVSLSDFCKITKTDLSVFDEVRGESESLGGLLLELNNKLPNAGEKIIYKNFSFTVVAVDPKKIKKVRVYVADPSQ